MRCSFSRVVAVHKVALQSAHTSSTLSCSSLASCRGTRAACPRRRLAARLLAGQLEAHASQALYALRRSVSNLVLEFEYCVLWVLTTQRPSGSRK